MQGSNRPRRILSNPPPGLDGSEGEQGGEGKDLGLHDESDEWSWMSGRWVGDRYGDFVDGELIAWGKRVRGFEAPVFSIPVSSGPSRPLKL